MTTRTPLEVNQSKRELFERWVPGGVTVWFDATHADVQLPEAFKIDHDYWMTIQEAFVYTSHFDGHLVPIAGSGVPEFDYSIPWHAVHAMYSQDFRESHVWADDIDRATRRFEATNTTRPLPS